MFFKIFVFLGFQPMECKKIDRLVKTLFWFDFTKSSYSSGFNGWNHVPIVLPQLSGKLRATLYTPSADRCVTDAGRAGSYPRADEMNTANALLIAKAYIDL